MNHGGTAISRQLFNANSLVLESPGPGDARSSIASSRLPVFSPFDTNTQGPSTVTSPEKSPLFVPWQDPGSGVTSYILTQRVAPVQEGFYFVNPHFTADGRYLWLYCVFPPASGAGGHLAVIDFEQQEVRLYPETLFSDASPFVDVKTGEAYWATGLEVWKRGPRQDDCPSLVNVFPKELAKGRHPWRLATHLTRSADGSAFAIDAQIGNQWFVGALPLDAARPFELWQLFEDCCYNHAQFSPTDPDAILMAQDGWTDAATGQPGKTTDRLWLIRRGEKARPIIPNAPLSSDHRGHEWWDSDGQHVWYIDYRQGTERVNILTGERKTLWPHGHTHSHCDTRGRYLVGDIAENPTDWRLAFYNINTGREVPIVSDFPVFPSPRPTSSWSLSATTPSYDRGRYHVHPHPKFCMDDRYVCYTTNVLGNIDLAIVAVEELVARTS